MRSRPSIPARTVIVPPQSPVTGRSMFFLAASPHTITPKGQGSTSRLPEPFWAQAKSASYSSATFHTSHLRALLTRPEIKFPSTCYHIFVPNCLQISAVRAYYTPPLPFTVRKALSPMHRSRTCCMQVGLAASKRQCRYFGTSRLHRLSALGCRSISCGRQTLACFVSGLVKNLHSQPQP